MPSSSRTSSPPKLGGSARTRPRRLTAQSPRHITTRSPAASRHAGQSRTTAHHTAPAMLLVDMPRAALRFGFHSGSGSLGAVHGMRQGVGGVRVLTRAWVL